MALSKSVVWSIGIVGTLLSAVPGVWLEQYTNFMIVLGGVLVPIGGIMVAHYYLRRTTADDAFVASLYDEGGAFAGFSTTGIAAWAAGGVMYFAAGSIGGTVPALAASVAVYVMLRR